MPAVAARSKPSSARRRAEGVTVDEVPGYNWSWSDVRVEVYN